MTLDLTLLHSALFMLVGLAREISTYLCIREVMKNHGSCQVITLQNRAFDTSHFYMLRRIYSRLGLPILFTTDTIILSQFHGFRLQVTQNAHPHTYFNVCIAL